MIPGSDSVFFTCSCFVWSGGVADVSSPLAESPLLCLLLCPSLNVCVEDEGDEPVLTPTIVNRLGGLAEVGETAIGDGEGVRARGLNGILCTLLRLFGDFRL